MLSMKFSTFVKKKQKPEESLDMYYTRLKNLATHCEFNSVDREIKSQIIQFCVDNILRLKALQDPTLTLDKILTLSRTLETSKVQAAQIVSPKNLKLLNWTENLLKRILKIKDVFTVVNHILI